MSRFVLFLVESESDKEKVIVLSKQYDIGLNVSSIKVDGMEKLHVLNYGEDMYGVNTNTIISIASDNVGCETFDEYISTFKDNQNALVKSIKELRNSKDYDTQMRDYLQKIEPLEARLKELMSVPDSIFSKMSHIDRQLPKEQFEKEYSEISDAWHKAQLKLHESQEYKDVNTKINNLTETYSLLNRSRTNSEEMIEYQTEICETQIFPKAKENFDLLKNYLCELFKSISKLSIISHFGHEQQIKSKKTQRVSIQALTIETFAFLEYDTLLEITK